MYEITREIGIDAGHRVPDHGSKCKNLHGHRYKIQVTCQAEDLQKQGEQTGMVLDFGFLKEEMMEVIDAPCDHGTILYAHDRIACSYIAEGLREHAVQFGSYRVQHGLFGKVYLVNFVPTAENLARHWFELLQDRVEIRSAGVARLTNVRVWETPNCFADFSGCKEG